MLEESKKIIKSTDETIDQSRGGGNAGIMAIAEMQCSRQFKNLKVVYGHMVVYSSKTKISASVGIGIIKIYETFTVPEILNYSVVCYDLDLYDLVCTN